MSLAEQLRKLQIPGQAVIQQISSKSVSLLFDVKTAASLDNEAIQSIGFHGFKELLSIEPAFQRFDNLFNPNSIQFQRNLVEKNVSTKIKRKIKDYLILLSPYILLKPAQKTLEWLIRRYQCHIWDKDALIASILPFHESLLFGRIIQLFGTAENNDSWDWLLTFQKEGTGFGTQSLINYCTANRKLLTFICQMAEDAKEALQKFNPKSELKIVFSFHARMLASVIDGSSVVGEDIFSFLLPFIHSGLKSQTRDYVCSTYMIIAALCSKTKLMKDVTKAILASVLKSLDDSWYEEGLLCFLSVIQLQKVKVLSNRIFKLFHDLNSGKCIELLKSMEKEHDISILIDLLTPLLGKSIVSATPDAAMQEKSVMMLQNFIEELSLNQKQISLICKNLVENCIENDCENLPQCVSVLLTHLAVSHSAIFDECIGSYFKNFSVHNQKKELEQLKKITTHCLSSEKHCVYGDSDIPLLLSLNHPDANMRIIAVQQLFATFKSEDNISDKEFFTDAVSARLNDDNPDVVRTVLKFPKSVIKLLDSTTIQQQVMKLMQRSEHYNLNELIVFVIQSFPKETSILLNEFVYALFGQLMVAFTGKRNKKLVEALDSVEFDSENVMLKGISKALFHIPTKSLSKGEASEEMIINAFLTLIRHVADTILSHENKMAVLYDFWNYLQKLPIYHHLHFTGLLLLIYMVGKMPIVTGQIMKLNFTRYFELCSSYKEGHDLLNAVEKCKTGEEKIQCMFTQYLSYIKSDSNDSYVGVLDQILFSFLHTVTISFVNNQLNLDESSFAKQKLFNIISIESVNTSSSHSSFYRILVNQFLSKVFLNSGEMMSFLCSLYMKLLEKSKMNDETFKAAVCSLHITKSLLSVDVKEHITAGNNIVYATHIALLSHPLPLIRQIVLTNIGKLCKIAGKSEVWGYMLKKAKQSTNEIVIDPTYIKKCWQSSFCKKEVVNAQFSRLIQKSKKEESDEQNISTLHELIKIIHGYPVSLQVSLLYSLELVDSKLTIEEYIPLLRDTLKKKMISDDQVNVVLLILKCIQPTMLNSVKDLFPLLVECLRHEISSIRSSAFQLITPLFYSKTSRNYQSLILQELLNLLLLSESIILSTEIRTMIKSLDLDTENVSSFLGQFCDKFDLMYTSASSCVTAVLFDLDEDDLKMPMWRTLSELLDATSHKETKNPELLVPNLFRVFERCLKCKGVEYVKQLILQTLLMVTRQDISKLSEDQFQVEVLIQCLQSSSNMHTNQQCLLVLSNAARYYPTRVLHNVMHIFSFMGGTMLRLDNAFSFEIMEKTIDAVIPVLIYKDEKSQLIKKRPSESSINEVVHFILQTFVDSIPHCPEHRRHHIIKHLVKLLQPSEYLHMVMILLLKKVAMQPQKQASEEENMKLSPVSFEFCKDLYSSYSIPVQVHSLYKMVAYLNTESLEKKDCTKKGVQSSTDLIFDVRNKQAFVFKGGLISFVLEILQNENLVSGYDVKPQQQEQLTQLYLQLVEELLSYSDRLKQSVDDTKVKTIHITPLQHKVSEVISQLYVLLPFDSFLTIVSQLLFKDNELMRKKSLELLCKKLASLDELSTLQENAVIQLFKSLLMLVKHKEEYDESAVNKQLILYAIKLIAIKLCKNHKEPFLQAVPIIAQLYSIENSNKLLAVNAMLCVAELASLLKAGMLPYLPIIMKPLFSQLSIDDSAVYKKADPVLGSYVTILHTVLKAVPQFLSPYVNGYLLNVASYDAVVSKLSDKLLLQKITSLKEDMGKFFPPRVLFPAIKTCFQTLLDSSKERTVGVIDVYRYSFKTISKADANSNFSKDILDITKIIFDARSVLSGDEKLCDTLESLTIQAFQELILKLTENTLRPMYLDLLNWSIEESDISIRLLSFYRLSVEISKSLKSLFLLFVGHVLKNCKDVLTKVNTIHKEFDVDDSEKLKFFQQLLVAILGMLSNCFFYDSQGFINKDRFESILQPLVDQMENKVHGNEYLSFAKDHLTPCIVNFAAAVNDPTCWKQLNHQILLKTKSEDENIRLISLYVIEQIYSRLGESYMILIPETIPFLAEILEDDSIEVEKQCQKVIQAIEDISGESIQKYF